MNRNSSPNVVWQANLISKNQRNELLGFRNIVLWITGLPRSGKSTLAFEIEKRLYKKGVISYVLDGDNIRHGHNSDLEPLHKKERRTSRE